MISVAFFTMLNFSGFSDFAMLKASYCSIEYNFTEVNLIMIVTICNI